MLRFDFKNLMADIVGEADGLTPGDVAAIGAQAPAAHQKFQDWRASMDAIFYDLAFDDSTLAGMESKAKEMSRFENLVVLGIGGSALGLRCLAGALLPPFWNLMDSAGRKNLPRLFVCDNIDPDTFAGLLNLIDLKKSCFTVISKSGKTTETAAQFFVALEHLKKKIGKGWQDHVVIITDPDSGELRPMVRNEGLASFPIPPKLGGRFSVLSPVGLFPAACVGIDIRNIMSGARAMAQRCASASLESNPAYQIGGYQHWFDARKKKPISVMLPYSDALALSADWYAQLWAESLGKDGKGSTPVKALGATDQHSQVQLYMEGPKDKIFTFIGADAFRTPADATRIKEIAGSFDYLVGHDFGEIIRAEQKATSQALAAASRPNMTVTMPVIDAHHIGEFFMVYEIATAFAGALYGINPFDQPGVELGKKLTKEMLTQKS
ncbi:MAG: glucose-6-phosphate isomerase [Pseudomonadota bacterium]